MVLESFFFFLIQLAVFHSPFIHSISPTHHTHSFFPSSHLLLSPQRLISTSLTGTVKFTGDESPLVLGRTGDSSDGSVLPTTPPALDIGEAEAATEAAKWVPGEGEGDVDI